MKTEYYDQFDKMQINSKKDIEGLTFKAVNFRDGMAPMQIDCELYCIEKNAMVCYGTIQWIAMTWGQQYGLNIINKSLLQQLMDKPISEWTVYNHKQTIQELKQYDLQA